MNSQQLKFEAPLAEKLRPKKLSDVIGQKHLIGQGKIITEIIASGRLSNLILWGPAGSGKTTLARILAKEVAADFHELSAVNTGKKDINQVIDIAKDNIRLGQATVIFIDEMHRFNKAQQDAFLPFIENGTLILIGATTENPSFEIIGPIISRSKVLVLKSLTDQDIKDIIKRAMSIEKITDKKLPLSSIDLIANLSVGDARVALNTLGIALSVSGKKPITKEIIETAAQEKLPTYDKAGENHYNLISAFIKSMRGSDANAAIYYLARMLDGGEDPKFIARRMIIFASEDIGMAAPAALNIAVSAFQAVERIGLPEASYNLFHAATVMAKAPKSRQVADAMHKAMEVSKNTQDLPVPLHIRNAPTKLMKDLGYGKGSKWEAGFKHPKGFMPDELNEIDFFN